ncbi:MAG: response regulator [Ignavibacteriales bacterium]|nr:response regulator [Ignavibacteriales bacterium]
MKKVQILYVDDEVDALHSLQIGLEDRGYDVLIAESGKNALELLKKNTPDVIIADLRMHPMNGFELFQEVKKNTKMTSVPFFFLTAVDDFLAQKYGQTLGVDAYITKPIELDYLETIIKRKLGNQ